MKNVSLKHFYNYFVRVVSIRHNINFLVTHLKLFETQNWIVTHNSRNADPQYSYTTVECIFEKGTTTGIVSTFNCLFHIYEKTAYIRIQSDSFDLH